MYKYVNVNIRLMYRTKCYEPPKPLFASRNSAVSNSCIALMFGFANISFKCQFLEFLEKLTSLQTKGSLIEMVIKLFLSIISSKLKS